MVVPYGIAVLIEDWLVADCCLFLLLICFHLLYFVCIRVLFLYMLAIMINVFVTIYYYYGWMPDKNPTWHVVL